MMLRTLMAAARCNAVWRSGIELSSKPLDRWSIASERSLVTPSRNILKMKDVSEKMATHQILIPQIPRI